MKTITDPPIAIIGMGSLFAQAARLSEYWRLLFRGIDAISEPPETHAHLNDYYDPDPTRPDHIYCKNGGFLKPIPFDPTEFGIPPAALEATDSSQLLGLVAAKMALNDAGYGDNGRSFDKEKTSVILGVTGTQELVVSLGSRLGHPKWQRALDSADIAPDKSREVMAHISNAYVSWQESSFPGLLGNVVAGRLCNRLDLGGTNCVVDAACASSLGAVHMALMELMTGRSKMVVTGGVDTLNDIFMHMCFSKTGVLSKGGSARPFSRDADGTVLGEGVALLVLKRLEDAIADQDRIYAVIKGLGSSSDGKSQSIYAPRAEGQIRALETAYARAGVSPETIDLVEAHGTGTRVGDQVEFKSLCNIFGQKTAASGRCALGSVKSMIGHTKAAAGAAGLVKAALSLYHKVLPPTLKVTEPDPQLKIEESPFYLPSHALPWLTPKGHPRRAGVSAFGFGGSNFHAVLEEYDPKRVEPAWDGTVEILAFSDESLAGIAEKIKSLSQDPDLLDLPGQLAFRAAQSRKSFQFSQPHRLLLAVDVDSDIRSLLNQARACCSSGDLASPKLTSAGIYYGGPHSRRGSKVAMVFPGQGSQYPGMGREWTCIFPETLAILEKANDIWSGDGRLADLIYPIPSRDLEAKNSQELRLRHTHAAQMALGAIEAGMLAVLRRFKVYADAYCGHSYGELTALYAAGWCDLATLFKLSDARGRSMAQAGEANQGDSGTMLAVSAPLEQIEILADELAPDVVLANKNSPTQGVLSGTRAGIEAAQSRCRDRGWRAVPLKVAAAFHSPLIQPALAPFTQAVQNSTLAATQTPVYSNVTARPYPTDIDQAKALLQKQMISPVEFVDTVKHLHGSGVDTFIEVGPKGVLTSLINAVSGKEDITLLNLDGSAGRKNGIEELARMLCRLAADGRDVDLTAWEKEIAEPRKPRMRIMLSGANHVSQKSTKTMPSRITVHPQDSSKPGMSQHPIKVAEKPSSKAAVLPNEPPLGIRRADPGKIEPPLSKKSNNPKKRAAAMQPPKKQAANLKEVDLMSANSNVPADSGHLHKSLAIVQQGIHSLQTLHLTTAQTHQKFLDAQAEAGRTLQEMLKQTQLLAGLPLNENIQASTVAPSSPPRTQAHQPVPIDIQQRTAEFDPRIPASTQPQVNPPATFETSGSTISVRHDPAPMSEPKTESNDKATHAIRDALMRVVSELTGYPEEMLEPAMDIESDLGIDSIKRVEILSTLEERMPGLPTITPDMLGTLKTLGQIVEFLGGASSSAAPAPSTQSNHSEEIQKTLLAVVSELTGYPEEMLEPAMDIESDLGIDSIKRVEILSTLEERMPGLPTITPDMLGTLKTLGQIVEFLDGASSSAAPAPSTQSNHSEKIQKTLLAVVSELTGYPEEMLEPAMDIESDLGIDSIKRVEILSTLEERMPGLPTITPDMLGSLKTLGQIVDFLGGISASTTTSPQADANKSKHSTIIQKTLLAVVSELTGYPEEMLEPAMDIESDLGIDSIKRVEILSALEERMPELPQITPEMIGELKTLEQISTFLSGKDQPPSQQKSVGVSAPAAVLANDHSEIEPALLGQAPRKIVALKEIPRPTAAKLMVSGEQNQVFITRDEAELCHTIAKALEKKGLKGVIIEGEQEIQADLFANAAGLILMAPIPPQRAFALAKAVAAPLNKKTAENKTFFASISRLDGAFGFHGQSLADPSQGALAGLVKTAQWEWDNVSCRALDIAPEWRDGKQIAATVVDYLLGDCASIEIGLTQKRNVTLTLEEADYPEGSPAIESQDVIVVTGGGRGVTAEAIAALAQQIPCRMVLLGRSPAPLPEPEWLADVQGEAAMKKAILTHEFANRKATPKEIETHYRKWRSARDISATLARLSATGAAAVYYPQDVRDTVSLKELFAKIRQDLGPIKGVIHGAGVLEDRLIADKSLKQFQHVFGTKVDSLAAILEATAADDLKYLILFSSVSARIGNKGQADYAMANEVLNKIAWQQQQIRPKCKVISINWGPWDGGMVDPVLKREFQRLGVPLLPIAAGAQAMVSEMAAGADTPVEVVIGAAFGEPHPETVKALGDAPAENDTPSTDSPSDPLSLLIKREIDLKHFPILSDHILGGKPVVPLALITEWLSHSALHENPGLLFHGIDALRLLAGIKLDEGKKLIRLMAGKPRRKGKFFEVDVEIRNGKVDGRDVIHSRAVALLADRLPEAPEYKGSQITAQADPLDKSLSDIYAEILFHGERLKGIQSILSFSSEGMAARISSAPEPGDWMADPLRSQWILDPLVLDCAFQMAIIWCHEQLGKRCLPSFAAAYRQYREFFPKEGVTVVLKVHKTNSAKMIGDFNFLDSSGTVIAQLQGYEAIMDTALEKAFGHQNAA